MGKYDSLFADEEPAGKAKYGALFDEEPPKQFAQADTATVAGPNGPTLGVVPNGIIDNLKSYGQSVVQGGKALGGVIAHPSTLADPAVRHELERGASDVVTFGLAEKAARKVGELVGDPSFSQQQAQADAAAAPGMRTAGGFAASFLPSPGRYIAGEVGAAIPGRGMIPGAVRNVAQYEATAPLSAAVAAEPGHRMEAARSAALDPAGLIVSGGTGALTGALGRAPERVKARGQEAVSRGEAGGTATKGIASKANAVAGEGGENLYGQIGNDVLLEAGQSVLAKSNPRLVSKMYTRRLDKLAEQTEPLYQAIDDAPDPRFADPKKAPRNGGIDLGKVEERLQGSMDKALAEGHAVTAEAYDKALARLRSQYGTDGKITQGEKLPARSMRNYANTLGEGLLPESMDPKARTLAQQAKRAIYRDVVGAIEDEGDRVGIDTTELRRLNKKISTFAATRDALADRAARAEQGHTTLGNLAVSSALIGGGGATGGIEGAIGGAALDAARRLAMPTGRAADFALAKLVQASRAGAKPLQLGQIALQLGVSQQVAGRIARGGLAVLNEQPASERDYTQP